jgi:adenylate cyclase
VNAHRRLRARTVFRLTIVLSVTVGSGIIGALTARGTGTAAVVSEIATSALNGFCLVLLEITLQGPGGALLRRLPVLPVLVLRIALYTLVFIVIENLVHMARDALGVTLSPLDAEAIESGDLARNIWIPVGFNLFFVLRRLLGPRTLRALVTGRYHRPRQERRIVLFMDLVGSTALAEKLGDLAFHGFLNQVFYDVSDPVLETGGEIYRYVGDEVIVTWTFAHGIRDAACIRCVFDIINRLAARRADYQQRFGAIPRLRCALHAGNLIVGEMGEFKREIVMLGDIMNATARIEEVCRTTGHDVIAAAEVVHALSALPAGIQAESLGVIPLRGKTAALELFALTEGGQE